MQGDITNNNNNGDNMLKRNFIIHDRIANIGYVVIETKSLSHKQM